MNEPWSYLRVTTEVRRILLKTTHEVETISRWEVRNTVIGKEEWERRRLCLVVSCLNIWETRRTTVRGVRARSARTLITHFFMFSPECQLYLSFISQENHSNSNAQMHTQILRILNSRFALEHRYISHCRLVSHFLSSCGRTRMSRCVKGATFTCRSERSESWYLSR